jgi:hypothetical protein
MNKAYSRINWENYPSDATPINKVNLNRLDSATDILDDRVITLDTTKATKTEVATLVSDVTFEESTGIITITKKNGSKNHSVKQKEKLTNQRSGAMIQTTLIYQQVWRGRRNMPWRIALKHSPCSSRGSAGASGG